MNFSSDDVNEEMTKLKEALSRSSEKHIKSSNQYLEELHKDQLGSRKKTKKQKNIKEKIKADPDVFQRLVNGLRKHATNPKLSDKKVTIICPFDELSFNSMITFKFRLFILSLFSFQRSNEGHSLKGAAKKDQN